MFRPTAISALLSLVLFSSSACYGQNPAGISPAPNSGSSSAEQLDARDKVFYPDDTERLKPLTHKLLSNLWLDQKQIWTSPFRMHKQQAFWWVTLGAATAALVATDRTTIHTFENSPSQVRWANHVSNVGATYTVIPVVAGFYGFGIWRDNPKARETGVLGAEALLDSLIVVEVLKTVAGRNRPDDAHPGNWFSGGSSFPSGHSIASWTLASVVSHEYKNEKWVPFVAYGLASLVSGARFAAQKHYASDILAGGAMGWFIGRYVYQTHEDHSLHHHAWMKPQVAPEFLPGTGTYAVALNWQLGR